MHVAAQYTCMYIDTVCSRQHEAQLQNLASHIASNPIIHEGIRIAAQLGNSYNVHVHVSMLLDNCTIVELLIF